MFSFGWKTYIKLWITSYSIGLSIYINNWFIFFFKPFEHSKSIWDVVFINILLISINDWFSNLYNILIINLKNFLIIFSLSIYILFLWKIRVNVLWQVIPTYISWKLIKKRTVRFVSTILLLMHLNPWLHWQHDCLNGISRISNIFPNITSE